jgi:hypothetical protein
MTHTVRATALAIVRANRSRLAVLTRYEEPADDRLPRERTELSRLEKRQTFCRRAVGWVARNAQEEDLEEDPD